MALAPGTSLNRYEILGLIGRGAMGEVYRAHDRRIGRDVAVKILPEAFGSDPERLRRFDQEARAAGSLNHPNIVAIFDVGAHDAAHFVVSELLEGDTLRARLKGGALPLRKALEYGAQTARGLAAAHAKGIVHRDLKPENLFVTREGHIKILDFGLAKLVHGESAAGGAADSLMSTAMTDVGRVMGTVGYMAPEQVRGEPVDHRADIFALGCVLYEMIAGSAPFHRDSAVESMAAIVRDELPALPREVASASPALVALLRRCVEKAPDERFESARDLAFNLESLEGVIGAATAPEKSTGAATEADDLTYQRITFRRGAVWSARFTPDGHSVVYSAGWEGKPLELFWTHVGNPEARMLGFRDTDLLSVSASNEMAVLLRTEFVTSFDRRGTLARVPPMGGAAREVLHDVHGTDWTADGSQLAIVREKQGMIRLELPIGNVVYQTAGWISQVRISPDGRHIAFADHPTRNSDSGMVALVDRKGERRILSDGWGTLRGLAWAANGSEVWFTADRGGAARGLYAVTLDGTLRRVLQLASNLTIFDIARDGRVLVGHGPERAGINALAPGETRERDLSWLDWSLLKDISPDGRLLLIDETAEGGGPAGSVYVRPMDGSPAVRLGDGAACGMSADGQWVVAAFYGGGSGRLVMLPTGVGEARAVASGVLFCHYAAILPDNRHLVVSAHEPGHGVRLYRLDSETGEAQALSPEGVNATEFTLLPGGAAVAAMGADQDHWLYPLAGGDPQPLAVLERTDRIVRWLPDARAVLVYRTNELPSRMHRVDLETGERKVVRELAPPDPTGIYRIGRVHTGTDDKAYAYNYYMQLIDLHVIAGLR